jgi:hypothetical protein
VTQIAITLDGPDGPIQFDACCQVVVSFRNVAVAVEWDSFTDTRTGTVYEPIEFAERFGVKLEDYELLALETATDQMAAVAYDRWEERQADRKASSW